MRLLFIRHGQTDGNVAETVYGQTDLPLNETGRQESQTVRTHVEAHIDEIDAVYAADLLQTEQTAAIICPDQTIRTDARFREFDFGDATGHNLDAYLTANPDVADSPTDAYPGGESAAEMFDRVATGLLHIAGTHNVGDTILVVTSSGPFDCLYNFIDGDQFSGDSPTVRTGDVVEVHFDGTDFEVVEKYEMG